MGLMRRRRDRAAARREAAQGTVGQEMPVPETADVQSSAGTEAPQGASAPGGRLPGDRTRPLPGRAPARTAPSWDEDLADHSGLGPVPAPPTPHNPFATTGGRPETASSPVEPSPPAAAQEPALTPPAATPVLDAIAGPAAAPEQGSEDEFGPATHEGPLPFEAPGSEGPIPPDPAAERAAAFPHGPGAPEAPASGPGEPAFGQPERPAPVDGPPSPEIAPDVFSHPAPAPEAAHLVLLASPHVDWDAFLARASDEWGMPEAREERPGLASWEVAGSRIEAELVPAPMDANELEAAVRGNRSWRDGAAVVQAQVAHVIVRARGIEDPLTVHSALCAVAAAALGDEAALAAYVPGPFRVSDPATYIGAAGRMRSGAMPTPNWVTVVATRAEGEGSRGWTRGLSVLGHAELEVLRSTRPVAELYGALGRLTDHVVSGNPLFPGDTLDGPDGTPMPVVASDSVLYDEPTLKVPL